MNITNTKAMTMALLLLGAITLIQIPVLGQEWPEPGQIIGTAWTIGNAIVGETTLTPAYAISSWTYRGRSKTPFYYDTVDYTQKMKRDRLGNYFYYTKHVGYPLPPPAGPVTSVSNDAFPVNSVNKINLSCAFLDNTLPATSTILETHTEVVWLEKVEKTGLWPDDGPWTVWLKTGGSKTSCSGPAANAANYYYWVPATISLEPVHNFL
jgi:hypothetical protein